MPTPRRTSTRCSGRTDMPDAVHCRPARAGIAGDGMRRIALAIGVLIGADAALPRGASATDLPVRFGNHPGFDRMVFDWREPTEYRVDLKSGTAVIVFDRTAEIDEGALNASLAKLSSKAAVETDGQKLVLKLSLPEQVQLRHFRSGTKVVVDFTRSSEQPPPAQQAVQTAQAPQVPRELRPEPAKPGGKIVTPTPAEASPAKPEPAAPAVAA